VRASATFPFTPHVPERSSPSRVRFAARKPARPGHLRAVPKIAQKKGKVAYVNVA